MIAIRVSDRHKIDDRQQDKCLRKQTNRAGTLRLSLLKGPTPNSGMPANTKKSADNGYDDIDLQHSPRVGIHDEARRLSDDGADDNPYDETNLEACW